MYEHNVRSILRGLTDKEMIEALAIVLHADDAPPSPVLTDAGRNANMFNKCKRNGRTIRCTGAAKLSELPVESPSSQSADR
jgi:hypothetical protein